MKTLLTFLMTILISPNAFAYLDPGAGSMLLQMAVAGVMAALFTIKLYWYKLKFTVLKWFGKKPSNEEKEFVQQNNGSDKQD